MNRLEAHRNFFANLVTASAGVPDTDQRLVSAFATTPREHFVGPGPWQIFTRRGYITTPSDDPALLYQDIVVALNSEAQINNGQPTLHAVCLAALGLKAGDAVVHVGAGTGYYSAIISQLVGSEGSVHAYEIDRDLAQRAAASLAGYTARFVCGAMFIPCAGARDEETASRLAEAFARGDMGRVRTLRRGTPPDATCWCAGRGWWLSTSTDTPAA